MPMRATSSKNKTQNVKKSSGGKDSVGDKPQTNGTESVENGVNGTEDVDMVDDGPEKVKMRNQDGEDEMTVVVPPSNSSKLSGEPNKDIEGDIAMQDNNEEGAEPEKVDPKIKAITGGFSGLLYLGSLSPNEC